MPLYKLTYFDVKGRAEPIRLLLSYMGKPFEDNRITGAEWAAMKKGIKFGKLPILEIDGKRLYQSEPICRYLAKQANLAGSNDEECLEIDSIVGSIGDLGASVAATRGIVDPKAKEDAIEKVKKETVPYYSSIYDEIVQSSGYLANGKLSWADLFFIGFVDSLESMIGESFINKYPNLKAHREKISSLPGVKEWIANRKPGM